MNDRETPGEKTIRLGIESRIKDYHKAGDSPQVNLGLDSYPHGKLRKELSSAAMYNLVSPGVKRFFSPNEQATEEFEAVKL